MEDNINKLKEVAKIITSSKDLVDYAEEVMLYCNDEIELLTISNFIITELLKKYKAEIFDYHECIVSSYQLVNLLLMEKNKIISRSVAKKIFEIMLSSGEDPEYILLKNNWQQNNNEDELLTIVQKIINNNSDQVDQYRSGKKKVLGFFVGQVMKKTKGKANPKLVNKLLIEKLN